MKKNSRLMMIGAIAGIFLMLGAGAAMAGSWAGPTNINVLTGAQPAQYLNQAAQAAPVFSVAAGEILTVNDSLTVTLTGGLKFSGVAGALTMTASSPGTIDLGAGAGLPAVPLSGGTAGSTTATWRVVTSTGLGIGTMFTLSNPAAFGGVYDVSGVAPTASCDMLMDLKTILGAQIGAAAQSFKAKSAGLNYLFTGGYGLTVADGNVTPYVSTADVGSVPPYTKFVNGLLTGNVGLLTVSYNGAVGSIPLDADGVSAKKLLVTLEGNFTGVTSIGTVAGFTGSDSSGSTTGGVVGKFMINSAKTAAYAVNNADFVGAATAVSPLFTIDGTTTQTTRTFTAKVETFSDGAVWAPYTYYGPKNYFRIDRNGVSFSSNSIGPLNKIKITEKSNSLPAAGGAVIIQAFKGDGTQYADAAGVLPIMLLNRETKVISGSEMEARFAGPITYPISYFVAIQTTDALCTNVKQDATGITETVFSHLDNAL